MKKDIPVYEFVIDDSLESGVKTISLVDDPAIQSYFVVFGNDKPKPKYFKSDEYEQVVFGIALQPDLPIRRIDQSTGEEFYGVFTKETIKKIVHKFHKELQSNNVNLMHNQNAYVQAYMFSDYIVESDQQIEFLKTKGILDAKIGSWIVSYKIEDPEVFNAVLAGDFMGFSVECYLDTVLMPMFQNNLINNKIKMEMKKNNKTLKEKILALFADDVFERALVPELGFEIEWQEVGKPVNKVVVNENGEETLTPIGKGEFNTDMGIIVVDESSNLVEVRELPEQPEVEVEVEAEVVNEQSPEASVSGVTGTTTGTTETLAEPIPEPIPEISGVTGSTGTTMQGIEKTILEIVGNQDGQYNILVSVENGVVTSAEAKSVVDLMLAKQQEIDTLKLENTQLLAKVNEPIADPVLGNQSIEVDFSKLSAYEKLMIRRGEKPFGSK